MTDIKEVSEILKDANLYLNQLKFLNENIRKAEEQVAITSQETEDLIDTTIDNLLKNLNTALTKRKVSLKKAVQETKHHSLIPFNECREDILRKIEKTEALIDEGERIINQESNNAVNFIQKSSSLGSLPEIPDLREVTYISFQHEPLVEANLVDICSSFGQISRIAPVQISQLSEKPGAILVEWQCVDMEERYTDIQEFRLQRAFGDVLQEKHLIANFQDCYRGLDNQVLVKDLKGNQPYSFRVCCKFEGSNDWSPWSLSQVSATTISSFSWQSNPDFRLADDNKIATPIKDFPALLISDGPQMAVGYSIEFTYLEFDNKKASVGLVLPIGNGTALSNLKSSKSHFILENTGEIIVDGAKKSTKFSSASKGMKICFTCEIINDDKVMVNIDAYDRRVTYDWPIPKDSRIYFGAQLESTNTKIMVE